MDAKGLTVGNYIEVAKGKSKGVQYKLLREDIDTVFAFPENYNPIPLTWGHEWLLKFGFEDTTGGWGGSTGNDKHYRLGKFEVQTVDFDDLWHLKNKFDVKIKYVHQLQNLYFALTGMELETKSAE